MILIMKTMIIYPLRHRKIDWNQNGQTYVKTVHELYKGTEDDKYFNKAFGMMEGRSWAWICYYLVTFTIFPFDHYQSFKILINLLCWRLRNSKHEIEIK